MKAVNAGTLLIRADASVSIGTGHVMRCLALAQAWQDRGGHAVFALASGTPSIEQRLAEEGVRVERIDAAIGSELDAKNTILCGKRFGAQWIVLDGYTFTADYQEKIKTSGAKLLFIDDNLCYHFGV